MKKTYSAVGKVVSNVIKSFQLSRKRGEKLGRSGPLQELVAHQKEFCINWVNRSMAWCEIGSGYWM